MHSALQKTWKVQDLEMQDTPVKSSLSEARDKVSYQFFKDAYEADLCRLKEYRRTYREFYIYAVDGDDLNLPCSKQILDEGYRGRLYAKGYETHYPKMYTVFAYDILNGLICDFSFSNKHQELKNALVLIRNREKNSITIYDRLYGVHPTMVNHIKHGSHFVIRLKSNGDKISLNTRKLLESKSNEMTVVWRPDPRNEDQTPIEVRLIKYRNPKTEEMIVFATSLSAEAFCQNEIIALYQKRWEVETAFRDLSSSLKMGQWHSKKINGILQEVYALLWFTNNVRAQMKWVNEKNSFLEHKMYVRSNFKMCAKLIMDNIKLVICQRYKRLRKLIKFWLKRTAERRCRRSRSYPRVVKGKLSKFPVHSKVPRRAAC